MPALRRILRDYAKTVPGIREVSPHIDRLISAATRNPRRVRQYYVDNYATARIQGNQVLFESFWGKSFGCNPRAVYEWLMEHGPSQLDFVWVYRKSSPPPKDLLRRDRTRFVDRDSTDYAKSLLESKVLVTNLTFQAYFIRRESQLMVSLWHGVPLKTLGLDSDNDLLASANGLRNFIQASSIFLPGPYMARHVIAPYGNKNLTLGKCVYTGSPRLGLPRPLGENEKPSDQRNKVVLYAPTWRGSKFSRATRFHREKEVIFSLREKLPENVNIWVSIHHTVRNKFNRRIEGVKFLDPDQDIYKIANEVDILVSDYSSLIVDFLALEKPVVLYTFDYSEYKRKRGFYIDIEELGLPMYASSSETVEAVRSELKENSGERKPEIQNNELSSVMSYEDGNGARDVSRQIVRLAQGEAKAEAVEEVEYDCLLLLDYNINLGRLYLIDELLQDATMSGSLKIVIAIGNRRQKRSRTTERFVQKWREKVDFVFGVGPSNISARAWNLYARWNGSNTGFKQSDMDCLAEVADIEARRRFGDASFRFILDFSKSIGFNSLVVTRRCTIQYYRIFNDREKESIFFERLSNLKKLSRSSNVSTVQDCHLLHRCAKEIVNVTLANMKGTEA